MKMMKRILKKGLKIPLQWVRGYRVKRALIRLTSHKSRRLKIIGQGLQESLANKMTVEEQQLITLIEDRRSSLLKSDKEIAVIDYGAGSPSSNRTKKEMKKGVQKTAFVSDVCQASKSKFWATFLFKLIRKLEPSSCIELGSCVGISACYQAVALSMNGKGDLMTLEGSPEIANIAVETLENMNLQNTTVVIGPFYETFKGVLESSKPIDFFFNDGHHDHDAVLQYFNEALPYLADEAVIIFDDISWSPGMRKAWREIEDDKRVTVSIDIGTIGIALVENTSFVKEKFKIPL